MNAYGFDQDYGSYTGHPADPRTAEIPDYALSQAADHAQGIPTNWLDFLSSEISKYDCGDIKSWSIKLEDIRDCDAGQLLVLAITGTNEQAAAARLYLQEAFCEHHSELIDQLAVSCDDAHDGGCE